MCLCISLFLSLGTKEIDMTNECPCFIVYSTPSAGFMCGTCRDNRSVDLTLRSCIKCKHERDIPVVLVLCKGCLYMDI